jgi:hypothetical protein
MRQIKQLILQNTKIFIYNSVEPGFLPDKRITLVPFKTFADGSAACSLALSIGAAWSLDLRQLSFIKLTK